MLKEHAVIFRRLIILLDLGIIAGAFFLAYFLRAGLRDDLYPLSNYMYIFPLLLFLWVVSLYFFGMYNSFRVKRLRSVISTVLKSAFVHFSFLEGLFIF